MVSIPSEIMDTYREFADDFINLNFGVNCRVVYPSKKEACANCTTALIGGRSKNVYLNGGPAPFTFGVCPLCGGSGFKEISYTEEFKMRLYWRKKDWIRVADINVPDAEVQAIGFMTDMPKLLRAEQVILNCDLEAYKKWRYVVEGEPLPHGFGHDRYFIVHFKRA